MLPYALAIAVGLSSSILFLTAFFFRDIHRQDDFFWSGVGLFYALVLWFCATSVTGAILLGQVAVVALLTAYFWQVVKLRKAIANPDKKDSLDSFSVVDFFKNRFKRSPSASIPTTKVTTEKKQIDETKPESTSFASKVTTQETKKTIPLTNTQSIPKPDEGLDSFPEKTTSLATAKLNEVLDAEESETITENKPESPINSVTTPPPIETETSPTEEVKLSITEATESEDRAIAAETVTVVEEETNWDDEVEDIPSSSIKVIKEVPPKPDSEDKE